ncbi:TPA: hypothetical protein ACX3KD_005009 [Raoultella ornithinolytica]
MTDITELAQSLKRRAASANEFGESLYVKADDILALVEALEKAQAQSSKWLEAYHKAVSIGARYEERIAELESRTVTVKLPDYRNIYKGTFADEVEHQVRRALDLFSADAGIKWEAE